MKHNTCILLRPRRAPCLGTGDVKPAPTLLFMCRKSKERARATILYGLWLLIAVLLMFHLIRLSKNIKGIKRKKAKKKGKKQVLTAESAARCRCLKSERQVLCSQFLSLYFLQS